MNGQPAKVVYIKTQYVETDALSFKSVVQNLTGKDSVIPTSPKTRTRKHSPSPATRLPAAKKESAEYYRPVAVAAEAEKPEINKVFSGGGFRNSFLMRDLSFKEFEKLLKELPPMDDFHTLFRE